MNLTNTKWILNKPSELVSIGTGTVTKYVNCIFSYGEYISANTFTKFVSRYNGMMISLQDTDYPQFVIVSGSAGKSVYYQPAASSSGESIDLGDVNVTLEITGGNDVEDEILIDWLMNNATLVGAYSYDLAQLNMSAGQHTIKVKSRAQGYNDSDFSNSITVNALASPTNILFNESDGYVYFDEVPNATSYELNYKGTKLTTTESAGTGKLKISLNNYLYLEDNGASFSIDIRAKASGYIDGKSTITITISSSFDGFYIKSLEDDNTITFSYYKGNSSESATWEQLFYSYNGKYWSPSSSSAFTKTVNRNQKIYYKINGVWDRSTISSLYSHQYFYSSKTVDIGGKIASILNAGYLVKRCFYKLFNQGTYILKIVDASQLVLPTFIGENCYEEMFYNCTTLVYAPALLAITLAKYCYSYMFYGCSSLITAPALPVTTLANYCYWHMFDGCSSLTIAPTLPATTLASSCYSYMFNGCSSLTSVPALPVTTLAENCYSYMFSGCSSITSAPALPATTLASSCYSRMFQNCSSLTSTPELSATVLTSSCYSGMFSGCSSLTTAPALPATTLADFCYSSMFSGCTNLTTTPVLPATTLTKYCYDSMFQNCSSLTTAPVLPATVLAEDCYKTMFEGCISLTTAPTLPATILIKSCYLGMFRGCTSLTTAPALPATTLTSYCYEQMFKSCSSLTTAPALPATTLEYECYYGMFDGCTSLTTLPELPATTLAERCYMLMFANCSSLKLSTVQTGEYINEYRIPYSGTGTTASSALHNMFISTGGTFTGTPSINTIYYTSNTVIPASTGYSGNITTNQRYGATPVATRIKFDTAPTSDDDYDTYVDYTGNVTGLTSYSNKTKVYVWGMNVFIPASIIINNVETVGGFSYANAVEVTLTGNYDIALLYQNGGGGSD